MQLEPSAQLANETVVDRLQLLAASDPLRVAFCFDAGGSQESVLLSYGELDARARAIAHSLWAAGARGERALIVHPPGLDYIAALFGCLYAGVVAVPAYPPARGRALMRVRSMAEASRAGFVLTSQHALARAEQLIAGEPSLAKLRWLSTDRAYAANEAAPPRPRHDVLALLQYTSGSTSAPKGVMLTHQQFSENIRQIIVSQRLDAEDRFVSWLPPFHDMGLMSGILVPVWLGARSTLMAPSTFLQRPAHWLELITRERATISGGPDFAYELCVRRLDDEQRAGLDLSSWRYAFCGAERVSPETVQRFGDAFAGCGFDSAALRACYGLAEATVAVSFGHASDPVRVRRYDAEALRRGQARAASQRDGGFLELVSAGEAVDGVELRIVDPETRRALVERTVGEIWVHGANVALGYYGKPELSQQTFRAQLADSQPGDRGYLRTGDLGFLDGGKLFVVGRIKDLIIVAGANFYPEDIEAALLGSHPSLTGRTAAFALEGDHREPLVVLLEVDSSAGAQAAEIASRVRNVVADGFELPVDMVVLVRKNSLPRTSSGKLQRGECRRLYSAQGLSLVAPPQPLDSARDAAAPPALIAYVRRVVCELMGSEDIDIDESLLECGGHSLVATRLCSRVRDQLGVDLPLRSVFEAPSIRALAARIHALPRVQPKAASRAPKADRSGPLALSFSQERMWFLHQLEPDSAAYNVSGAAELSGPLDLPALEAALALLVARHEVLRTSYPSVDGEPRVSIDASREVPIALHDVSEQYEPLVAAVALASQRAHEPFDIAHDALMRVTLIRIGPEQHVLAVSMHHLITDAWSMGVLVQEWSALYAARLVGAAASLPALAYDYLDYAHQQRTLFDREQRATQLNYWKQQLSGVEPLELPTDRPRPSVYSSHGALEPLPLSDELLDALRARAAEQGVTLFMLMLAAFQVLLHRYTDQNDIVVAVPIANRHRLASEPFIGTLVNTLALRTQIDPEATFSELLVRVRETSLDAYAHQELPFEYLVAELGVAREAGRSPLVQVMFDFQNAPLRVSEPGALNWKPLALSRGAAQFDLSLLIMDTELGRLAGVEYRTALFERSTIERLLGHYTQLLIAIAADPRQRVETLPLMAANERVHTIAAGRARPLPPLVALLPDLIAQQVAAVPDARAVSDASGSLSYAELEFHVSALAAQLRERGVLPGQRVAVYLERSKALIAALLAVFRVGGAYVPLDPIYPAARRELILDDADPSIVITQSNLVETLSPRFAARALLLEDVRPSAGMPAAVNTPAERIAYVLYTSGSTGRPKGVEVSLGALTNFLTSMAHTPGLRSSDRVLSVTTVAFDIAGLELFLPLIVGAEVYVAAAQVVVDGPALIRCMGDVQPTLMQATPATWKLLLESGFTGDVKLKVLCGGEVLPRELVHALLPLTAAVWNMYGPTETTIWSTLQRVDRALGPVPVGRAIDRTDIYVLDRRGQPVPFGVPGEICIGGAGVARGYLGQPELTSQRFVADPFAGNTEARLYRTGDRGLMRSDGTLFCLGRLDDQIKVRGFRVEPGEIETVLRHVLSLQDVVVVARKDGQGDVRLVAYGVGANARQYAEARDQLRARLPDYMVPSVFVGLERLPHTPNGKIDRKALPPPAANDVLGNPYEPARDDLEARMVELWQDILAVPRVGLRDNFFQLGGHSLLAVRLFARIVQTFGVELPLPVLLEAQTLAELSERVRNVQSGQRVAGTQRLQRMQSGPASKPPIFCVHGAGGNVLNLYPLSRHFQGKRAFYAFAAQGVDGISPPAQNIETLAREYVAELRTVAPHGPYHLSGYCGGGLVAYEMALELLRAGEDVGLLALFNTYSPNLDARPGRLRQFASGVLREGATYPVQRAAAWAKRNVMTKALQLRIAHYVQRGLAVPLELRGYWLTNDFLALSQAYAPRPYPGRLTVIHATEPDPLFPDLGPELGWEGLARTIETLRVPGSHDTMLDEPHASVLAEQLQRALTLDESKELQP